MSKKNTQLSISSELSTLKRLEMKELFPLNQEQELFCLAWTAPGETFHNNTKSYAEAYGYSLPLREDGSVDTTSAEYLACKANGGRMMFNPSVRSMIQELFLKQFNEKVADARTSEIMMHGKDADSLQAIKIYNDLKQRVTKKIDVTVAARPLAGLTDEELEALANE